MKPTNLMKKMDTPTLKRLCERAIELKFSRGPNDRFWEDVDPNGVHVCDMSFYHSPNLAFWRGIDHGYDFSHNGGVNIRAGVVCEMKKKDGEETYLICDFDEQDFMALPDLKVETPKERARQRKRRRREGKATTGRGAR